MNYLKKLASSPLFIHLFALGALLAAPVLVFGAISDEQASFTPLTSLPGVAEASQQVNLPAFLNSLYRTCVGAAAVLAVLQIVRGGVTYMLGDSVTEKREARHHIALAVFGLVLVLAPALVFGIIDRRILDLSVDVSQLVPPASSTTPQYANQTQQNICQSYDQLAYATVPSGQQCNDVKGEGWVTIDGACCSGEGNGQTCCGYDESLVTPPPPVGTSGDFNYSYTLVADPGTSSACISEEDVMQFETMEQCVASEGTADNVSSFVTQKCDGTTVNPPQAVLNLDMCE